MIWGEKALCHIHQEEAPTAEAHTAVHTEDIQEAITAAPTAQDRTATADLIAVGAGMCTTAIIRQNIFMQTLIISPGSVFQKYWCASFLWVSALFYFSKLYREYLITAITK